MKLSEAARHVIDLAAKVRQYWEVELPKRHPNYPLVRPAEDSGPPPPEERRLRELLKELPADMIYKLALIMYLGRGDFGVADLAENYETLKQTKAEWAAGQMMQKAALADYLSEGLDELKKNAIDVDHLALKRAKSRK